MRRRFLRAAGAPQLKIESRPLPVPGRVEMPEAGLYVEAAYADPPSEWPGEREIAFIDASAVDGALRIRARERGDRFQPFGLRGSRKLSDFFVDCKVPRAARDLIPL